MKRIQELEIVDIGEFRLFAPGSLWAVIGKAGTGKTAVTLSLIRSMTTTNDTKLPLPKLSTSDYFLYNGAEGFPAFNNRAHQALGVDNNFIVNNETQGVSLLHDKRKVEGLARRYYEAYFEPPKVVIFDYLMRYIGGKDNLYSHMEDMLVNVRWLQKEFADCSVVVLHHTTKTGSTYLGGADLDAMMESLVLTKTGQSSGKIEPGKVKDFTIPTTSYRLVSGELAVDAVFTNGDVVVDDSHNDIEDIISRNNGDISDIQIYRELRNPNATSVTPKWRDRIAAAREMFNQRLEDLEAADLEDEMMGFG